MPGLTDVVQDADVPAVILEELEEHELRLFHDMRSQMEKGRRVEFREDHEGELIALETRLHRASDYK